LYFFITFAKTKFNFMTDKQIQMVIDLAKQRLANPPTKEEAIRTFQEMGWVDEYGKFRPQYKNLELALALNLGKGRY
jgi:hypothetical protein